LTLPEDVQTTFVKKGGGKGWKKGGRGRHYGWNRGRHLGWYKRARRGR
jgi:hypothetical protein